MVVSELLLKIVIPSTMRGFAEKEGIKVGFGEVSGTIYL